MCALAGIIMVARFNSVRVGHGESYLLITVLACFLGGVNPFGGFGRVVLGVPGADHPAAAVVGPQSAGRQPASRHRRLGHVADRRDDPALGRRAAQFSTHRRITAHAGLWRSHEHVDDELDRAGAEQAIAAVGRATAWISSKSRCSIRPLSMPRIPASCWRRTTCRPSARSACLSTPGPRQHPEEAIDFLDGGHRQDGRHGRAGAVAA